MKSEKELAHAKRNITAARYNLQQYLDRHCGNQPNEELKEVAETLTELNKTLDNHSK